MTEVKILHITLSMDTGGIENFIVNFARKIDRARFNMTVGCLDYGGVLLNEIKHLGHSSFVLCRRPGFDWKLILKLARIFRKEKYKIIHTHNQASHFYGGLAARLARVPCLITTEHSRHNTGTKLRRRIEKGLLYRITDNWVTVSRELAQVASDRDGLPIGGITIVPNGVDLKRFLRDKSNERKHYLSGMKAALKIPIECRVAIIVA